MNLGEHIKKQIGQSVASYVVGGVVIAVLLVGIFLFLKANPFNWNLNFFGINELKIDSTENVVEKVRKISEFTTACYYEEFVVKDEKKIASKMEKAMGLFKMEADSVTNEIVLLSKGTVRAGYDLSKLTENDMVIAEDTLSIKLPLPEIFDIIINPSDYEIFVEDGKWSHDEIVSLQSGARERVLNNAIANGILQKANTVGKDRIEDLFKTFGFNVVNVTTSEIKQ